MRNNYRKPKTPQKRNDFTPSKKNPKYKSVKSDDEMCNKFKSENVSHGLNDVAWYAKNEQMLRDAASYSYNSPLGSRVGVSSWFSASSGSVAASTNDFIPGVISFDVVFGPGQSTTKQDAANIAAQNIYSYVRYMNSGSKNYDPADLMHYLLAMDSAYAYWNYCKRLYGLVVQYSQYNWYTPKMLFQAQGVKFEDVYANLANFREYLNKAAAKLSAFCVPAVMPLFIRHSWMFSNVYKDSENLKAQQYIFVPGYFYKYSPTSSSTGGELVPIHGKPGYGNPDNWYTTAKLIADMETIIDSLSYVEDIGVMSGDILKAYGSERLFKLTPVTPDYTVSAVYNEEVLNQIHNATIIGSYPMSGTENIAQDPDQNILIYNPKFAQPYVYENSRLINMPWDNVTPANTMVATRLTSMLQKDADTANRASFAALGSEFIAKATMHMHQVDSNGTISLRNVAFDSIWALAAEASSVWSFNYSTNIKPAISTLANLSNFDWHPLVSIFTGVTTNESGAISTAYDFSGIIGDITNYTVMSNVDLQRIHTTAIMSEFNIPQLGAF